jgi:hypothetical protein
VANLNPFGGECAEENEATGHSTQKPVEIMRRPILNHSRHGEACYDPFLGSGSTLIAAESIGRICFGMDIDPRNVDVALLRWQRFTGKQAVLDGDGQTLMSLPGHEGRRLREISNLLGHALRKQRKAAEAEPRRPEKQF